MSEQHPPSLRKRTRQGFFLLTIRSAYLHALRAASVILLARWMTPADYGAYGIVNGYIAVSWFFCDVGLGGALIHQGESPTPRQLQACAAVQLSLSVALAAGFFLLAPMLARHHGLDHVGISLFRVLALTIPIYAVRATPRVLLERDLDFSRLGRMEIAESFVSYLAQIGLAAAGFGVWSFVWANVARAVTGTTLLISLTRASFAWPRWHWSEIRPLLTFGIPFQANAVVPALKGLIVPLLLGSYLSIEQVGLITWSLGLVSVPMVFAVNYNQVMFSSLSRLSASADEFRSLASRGMDVALPAFLFLYGLGAATAPSLIHLLFGARWAPAVEVMPLIILGSGLFTLRYLMAPILNASGRPNTRLGLETVGLVVEAGLSWFALRSIGLHGYLWAFTLTQFLLLAITIPPVLPHLRGETRRRFVALSLGLAIACTVSHFWIPSANLIFQIAAFTAVFVVAGAVLNPSLPADLLWILRRSAQARGLAWLPSESGS